MSGPHRYVPYGTSLAIWERIADGQSTRKCRRREETHRVLVDSGRAGSALSTKTVLIWPETVGSINYFAVCANIWRPPDEVLGKFDWTANDFLWLDHYLAVANKLRREEIYLGPCDVSFDARLSAYYALG